MEAGSVKKILMFWIVEDYLESRNAGPLGVERWKKRTRISVETLLLASGAVKGSGFKEFCACSGENDIFPGESGCQIVTQDKIMYWVKDLIPIQYKKLLSLNDYEEITTRCMIAVKANFFCPGYTIALVKSQMEGEERSDWVLIR